MPKKTLQEKYYEKTTIVEDSPVLKFLDSQDGDKKYEFLEVGAGTGRFPLLVQNKYKNINVNCLEISHKLADRLVANNLKTVTGSVLHMPFEDESFDIVHCSHLIEHFGYPEVTKVLDELFRVAKMGGYVIIRTPLMHPSFYNDIDHIRPYSLKTLRIYFSDGQQQSSPNFTARLVSYENRHWAPEFRGFGFLNVVLKFLWIVFGWPRSSATGYAAVFQKISK